MNTGIPGTGLYERIEIVGGSKMNSNVNSEYSLNTPSRDNAVFEDGFVPPYKVFGGIKSFFCFIIGLPSVFFGLLGILVYLGVFPSSPASHDITAIKIFLPVFLVGSLLYSLHFNNHRKANKNFKALTEYKEKKYAEYQENIRALAEQKQKMLDMKVNAINTHELFDGAKIFVTDYNNIIAFSTNGNIALWTEKNDDKMAVMDVGRITKITQEITGGKCFANIYTDSFENNVYQLFIGTAHGKDELETVRKLYNEIKNLYTALRKNNKG